MINVNFVFHNLGYVNGLHSFGRWLTLIAFTNYVGFTQRFVDFAVDD